ncbi:MAG: 3-keto-disaccharide hydrolase [Pirellulaceae bacterium]
MHLPLRVVAVLTVVLSSLALASGEDAEPIRPTNAVIPLFNGKNLDGLYTWLQDTKYEDPRKVFTVEDGMLHISGDAGGYICTKQRYRDYHLVVEYRWGDRTWQTRKTAAKDTGVIVHCTDPDGSFGNVFMAGIEAQIIEGGTGDFLVLPGTRADGSTIPASLTAEITKDRDGEMVWKKGGERTTLNIFGRINWFGRDPDWTDSLGYRGKQDVESPGQEWTRLDVICDGGHIVYRVNDVLVNEGFDSVPSAGKILIQTELAEVYVRRFELRPLD